MSFTTSEDTNNLNQKQTQGQVGQQIAYTDLDNIINKAIHKIGGQSENDICKYLPMPTGGYMHHFTLRKMKLEQPQTLSQAIDKYINSAQSPNKVAPKKRAARGSRKKRGLINLSSKDLERMLEIAKNAGDKEMIAKLSPKKSLSTCKRDLINSIRKGSVEQELWEAYVQAVKQVQSTQSEELFQKYETTQNLHTPFLH